MTNLLDKVRSGAGVLNHGSRHQQDWTSQAPVWAPNQGDIQNEIHIRHVVWPAEPYGLKHAKGTMEASTHVCDSLKIAGKDLHTVRYAALFHELGRAGFVADGDVPDAEREAKLAASSEQASLSVIAEVVESALRRSPPDSLPIDGEEWIGDVVRLVLALHREDPVTIEGDLRLVALRDAETLEEGRFWRERTFEHVRVSYQKLISPWAQQKPVQVRWLTRYGIGGNR